jgi:hypothetical protein
LSLADARRRTRAVIEPSFTTIRFMPQHRQRRQRLHAIARHAVARHRDELLLDHLGAQRLSFKTEVAKPPGRRSGSELVDAAARN